MYSYNIFEEVCQKQFSHYYFIGKSIGGGEVIVGVKGAEIVECGFLPKIPGGLEMVLLW
jgi:hypothetical protein